MLNPATEALEVAQAIHSLLERWSIDVFLGVVAMDVFLHLTEDAAGLEWRSTWNGVSVRGLRVLAYNGRLSVRAIVKTLSLIGFGVAISLEFFAIPYGERADELTAKDAAKSQLRVVAAFAIAGAANKDAGEAKERSGTLEVQAAGLRKQVAGEQLARVKIELLLQVMKTPRHLLLSDETLRLLRPFAGTPYRVFVFSDNESEILASDLLSTLNICGWLYIAPPSNVIVDTLLLPNGLYAWSTAFAGAHINSSAGQDKSSVAAATWFTNSGIWTTGIVAHSQGPMDFIIGQKTLADTGELPPNIPNKKTK